MIEIYIQAYEPNFWHYTSRRTAKNFCPGWLANDEMKNSLQLLNEPTVLAFPV